MGRKIVATALRDAGYSVEVHDDHFDQATPDVEWCRQVGAKGWIIVTKDRQIRCNRVELETLLKSGVPCLCLDGADMTGAEMSAAILASLPTALRMVEKFAAPFVAAISRSGQVSLLHTHDGMLRKIGESRDADANREKSGL